jgi:hypothetical protein
MDIAPAKSRQRTALAPQWRRTARAVFEWWWNLDRRRGAVVKRKYSRSPVGQAPAHIKRMDASDRPHPLDEAFVIAAMARQLEEIRNLPEMML